MCLNVSEYEIILAMGKSTDNSELICKRYCEQFSWIQVIEQEGRELANAPNCALRMAVGEYILFMDGDDFADTVALQALLEMVWQGQYAGDMIMTDFRGFYETGVHPEQEQSSGEGSGLPAKRASEFRGAKRRPLGAGFPHPRRPTNAPHLHRGCDPESL